MDVRSKNVHLRRVEDVFEDAEHRSHKDREGEEGIREDGNRGDRTKERGHSHQIERDCIGEAVTKIEVGKAAKE